MAERLIENKSGHTTWSFLVDLRVLAFLAALALGGWFLWSSICAHQEREAAAARKAKQELEEKEREMQAREEERVRKRHEEQFAAQRELRARQDKLAQRQAQERKERAAKEEALRQKWEAQQDTIEAFRLEREKAEKATLEASFADVIEKRAQAQAAPSKPATQPPVKIFALKDGRTIKAIQAIDGGDQWSIKTESGKFETIQKDSVEKVIEPDN